jgi:hypothetical protein
MTGFVVDGDAEGIIRGKKEINMGERGLAKKVTDGQDNAARTLA